MGRLNTVTGLREVLRERFYLSGSEPGLDTPLATRGFDEVELRAIRRRLVPADERTGESRRELVEEIETAVGVEPSGLTVLNKTALEAIERGPP